MMLYLPTCGYKKYQQEKSSNYKVIEY